MVTPETLAEIDHLIDQLDPPEKSPVIQAKTPIAQAELAETLIGLVDDLMDARQWGRAWKAAGVAETIAGGLLD